MIDLALRKQLLLRAVVDVYVRTAEPVGSRALVESCNLEVKSATVRNELAEMTDLGLLRQPHTSAGRIPSDLGYRFYVDRLMEAAPLDPGLWESVTSLRRYLYSELDEVLRQTCRLLSSLTQYASVAATPEIDSCAISQVHLTSLDQHRVLMVAIPVAGDVRHRILETADWVAPSRLTWLGNFISQRASSLTTEQIRRLPSSPHGDLPEADGALYRLVVETLREMLAPPEDGEVFVEGATQILRQPEFRDVERLQALLSALEQRQELLRALRNSVEQTVTAIRIGGENPQTGMQECSLVAARYSLGHGAYGSIGVIGPTRMDYRRAIGAVQAMAQGLSSLFTGSDA